MQNRQNLIKIRINHKSSECELCNNKKDKTLEMYDIKIGDYIITFCDECQEVLFKKLLTSTVNLQGKLKSNKDLKIINSRKVKNI